ncbi:MAG TPA: hypothetical protein DGH68_07590 [Bacteroidetes bacterium]|jgi:hypothetical protein|nr:hypothetical protein [Bacteroidota bacterium]
MRKFKLFIVNLAVCFLLPQLLLLGCSLIGFGIGAISDSSSRDGDAVPIVELRGLKERDGIAVVLQSGRRIEGDFISVREENAGIYRERYIAAVADLRAEGCVPLLDDSITFASRNAPWLKERGEFRGVDPGAMVVNQSGRRVVVSDLGELKADSSADVDLFFFSALVRERKLPFLTKSVLMKVKGDTTEVLVVDLVRVEVSEPRNAKFIGLAIGAAIDAVAIVLLTNSAEQSCNETAEESCHHSGSRK